MSLSKPLLLRLEFPFSMDMEMMVNIPLADRDLVADPECSKLGVDALFSGSFIDPHLEWRTRYFFEKEVITKRHFHFSFAPSENVDKSAAVKNLCLIFKHKKSSLHAFTFMFANVSQAKDYFELLFSEASKLLPANYKVGEHTVLTWIASKMLSGSCFFVSLYNQAGIIDTDLEKDMKTFADTCVHNLMFTWDDKWDKI